MVIGMNSLHKRPCHVAALGLSCSVLPLMFLSCWALWTWGGGGGGGEEKSISVRARLVLVIKGNQKRL